ncbi:NB-ARC domain disease resistance protein [Medicago truncatula]|uniref:NB-ARC domain disease resistance protein n=1 Tax=Medicago truncatula TaxID=3880 RepID=G7J0W8_MEDTR|nr:NB-ARC domain disease resistance protein [Medicago truncatula]
MSFTPISVIVARKANMELKVRVLRMWDSDKIHATPRKQLVQEIIEDVGEGSAYVVEKILVAENDTISTKSRHTSISRKIARKCGGLPIAAKTIGGLLRSKDFPLDKKTLVLLWMAEGFLDCSQEGKMAEEVGDDCFAELLSRSLIQQSNDVGRGKKFFIHDLINDLTTVVSGKSCSRLECGNVSKNVLHLSYTQEVYDIFMKFKSFNNFKCL